MGILTSILSKVGRRHLLLTFIFSVGVVYAALAQGPDATNNAAPGVQPGQPMPDRETCCSRVVSGRLRREQELRDALREIRKAIDTWHQACQSGLVGPPYRRVDDECYPPTLESLVEGIHPPNTNGIIRFLRRIPRDPITRKAEWGLRSVQDARDSTTWGGQNVYDIYSTDRFRSPLAPPPKRSPPSLEV